MLSVQAAQLKLQGDIILTYNQRIYQASTLNDLQTASKNMFNGVTELLFPDEVMILRSKADPQDMKKEEKKEKLDLSEAVAKDCDSFVHARSLNQISLEADIQQATQHRSVIASTIDQLGRLSDTCGGPLQAAIVTFDEQLVALQKQIDDN